MCFSLFNRNCVYSFRALYGMDSVQVLCAGTTCLGCLSKANWKLYAQQTQVFETEIKNVLDAMYVVTYDENSTRFTLVCM